MTGKRPKARPPPSNATATEAGFTFGALGWTVRRGQKGWQYLKGEFHLVFCLP